MGTANEGLAQFQVAPDHEDADTSWREVEVMLGELGAFRAQLIVPLVGDRFDELLRFGGIVLLILVNVIDGRVSQC